MNDPGELHQIQCKINHAGADESSAGSVQGSVLAIRPRWEPEVPAKGHPHAIGFEL
jgi:hypothetical protein